MTGPDLYETLGVERDASPEDLKRAYRKRAKKAHPDGGGSVEAFANLSRALAVLSDPESRKEYDRTGKVGEKEPDTREANALQLAAQTIQSVIDVITKRRGKPEQYDLVGDSVRKIEEQIKGYRQTIQNYRDHAAEMRKIAKRFKAKKGKANRSSPLFDNNAADAEREIPKVERVIEVHERAIEILSDHSWQSDGASPADYNPVGNRVGMYIDTWT